MTVSVYKNIYIEHISISIYNILPGSQLCSKQCKDCSSCTVVLCVPRQSRPSYARTYPAGQSHVNEPSELVQRPLRHAAPGPKHSSMSGHTVTQTQYGTVVITCQSVVKCKGHTEGGYTKESVT